MGTRTGTVVVCDDAEDTVNVVAAVVRNAGYTVHTAHNYRELFPILEKVKPDLLLCDIRMPGRDGLDVAEQLQKEGVKYPIVLMTAYNSTFYRAYTPYLGVSDVLAKPLDFDKLLEQIDTVLTTGKNLVH